MASKIGTRATAAGQRPAAPEGAADIGLRSWLELDLLAEMSRAVEQAGDQPTGLGYAGIIPLLRQARHSRSPLSGRAGPEGS